MRLGIDLDDTICRTTEIVRDRLEKYAKEKGIEPLEIMNDEDIKKDFFHKYIEDIYTNAEIKRNVEKSLKRLRNKGNEIFIITARGIKYGISENKAKQITDNWLKKHQIEVDKIIVSAYGEKKADICQKYKIDLMIEDDPYNYKKIHIGGTKCLLYDDREKYNLENNYVTNWLEVEKYIERNR